MKSNGQFPRFRPGDVSVRHPPRGAILPARTGQRLAAGELHLPYRLVAATTFALCLRNVFLQWVSQLPCPSAQSPAFS
jgi:hypothetical protein